MACSTILISAEALAQILEENIPWPPGTKLRSMAPGGLTFEIKGPDVPDAPGVVPVFTTVNERPDIRRAIFSSWLPSENPL